MMDSAVRFSSYIEEERENSTRSIEQIKKDLIVRALEYFDGDKTEASRHLGITVRTLQMKVIEYKIKEFKRLPGRPRK